MELHLPSAPLASHSKHAMFPASPGNPSQLSQHCAPPTLGCLQGSWPFHYFQPPKPSFEKKGSHYRIIEASVALLIEFCMPTKPASCGWWLSLLLDQTAAELLGPWLHLPLRAWSAEHHDQNLEKQCTRWACWCWTLWRCYTLETLSSQKRPLIN